MKRSKRLLIDRDVSISDIIIVPISKDTRKIGTEKR